LEADMTKRSWIPLVVIALAGAASRPGLAHADYDDGYGYGTSAKEPWEKLRFEGGIGALVGSQRVSYVAGSAGGMHFDAGARRDRWMAYAEYDLLSIGESSYDDPDPLRGLMHRAGVNLRYSVGAFGGHDIFVRGDIWTELGVGHEQVYWYEGGKLGRKDISFGFGAQATFKLGRAHPRYVGVYYAMKGWVAAAPDRKDDQPVCAGPCDTATGPSPWDMGVFFNFGVPFGR
jgi:hypothetical protein